MFLRIFVIFFFVWAGNFRVFLSFHVKLQTEIYTLVVLTQQNLNHQISILEGARLWWNEAIPLLTKAEKASTGGRRETILATKLVFCCWPLSLICTEALASEAQIFLSEHFGADGSKCTACYAAYAMYLTRNAHTCARWL